VWNWSGVARCPRGTPRLVYVASSCIARCTRHAAPLAPQKVCADAYLLHVAAELSLKV